MKNLLCQGAKNYLRMLSRGSVRRYFFGGAYGILDRAEFFMGRGRHKLASELCYHLFITMGAGSTPERGATT